MSEIWKALLEVQKEAPALQRDGLNPHFKSSYVTLETVMQTVLPILNRHGVVVLQGPHSLPETYGDVLVTKLVHAESGEVVESVMKLHPAKDDMQGYGSAMTYARRYAIMGMLGLVADADDDGNAASKPDLRTQAGPKPKEAPAPTWPPKNYTELEKFLEPWGIWEHWMVSGGQAKGLLFGEEVLGLDQKAILWDANIKAAEWLMENFPLDAMPPATKGDVATAWAFALAGKQQ
jgi:hypothetical protein